MTNARRESLIRRINRRLLKEHRILRESTDEALQREFGEYYLWDVRRAVVIEKEVQLEELARRLRCKEA